MKKLFFSFVMMLTLLIVTGTVMAADGDSQHPYKGQTYTYTLSGITVVSTSTATVSYDGTDAIPQSDIVITAGTDKSISFTVAYGANATSGNLKVKITDATGCYNQIQLAIAPVNTPTLTLKVTSSVPEVCQNVSNTANNTAGSVGQTNTVTFTVTPILSSGSKDYAFTFDLNDYILSGTTPISIVHTSGNGTVSGGSGSAFSISGSTEAHVFTVTFATTTGKVADNITGTVTNPVLSVNGTGTGTFAGTYIATGDNHADITVKSTPAIGTFTGL